MARLVAILKALLRITWRGERSLGSFATNNFFLVTAILPQYAGAFLFLIAGLVMMFPLSRDPLRKIPESRLASWPLNGRERSLLRVLSPWTSPATWIVAGLLIWSLTRSLGLGLPLVLTALVAVSFLLPRVSGAGEESVWRVVQGFPLPLRELMRKNLRDLVSTLDLYCAAVLALSGCVYRIVSANANRDATLGITLLVVLALTSYGQCLFGLDGRSGLTRYRLMPLRGWQILAVKGGAYLIVVLLLTLPLAPLAGLSAGLTALAVGHSESVPRSALQTRWRFTSGSSITNSLSQVVAMTLAGVATFRITAFVVICCATAYAASVWWYGRKMEDSL